MTLSNEDLYVVYDLMDEIERMTQDGCGDYPDVDPAEIEYEMMKIVVRDAENRAAAEEVARRFGYQGGIA